jgi:hypothetical protein
MRAQGGGDLKLAIVVLISAVVTTPLALGASSSRASRSAAEDQFVAAANRGDYATVCRLYSRRYLKVSQDSCRALYRQGATIFGPYDYRIVRRRITAGGRRHVDLILRRHASFIELVHERAGWRIVAGGW